MESLEYIDSYFKGELTPDEVRQFELRIEQDPVFAQDVAFYVSASGILKEKSEETVRERFRELEQMQPVKMKQSPVRKLVYWVAAAAVSIGVIVRMFFLSPATPLKMADNYIENEMTLETLDKMGPTLHDSLELAKNFYLTKKYPEALVIYDALKVSNPENDEIILNAGIVSLKAGRIENAINYFKSYEQNDLFDNKGKFYHAAALLKRNQPGDQETAKGMLEDVVKNKYTNHELAAKWLKEM